MRIPSAPDIAKFLRDHKQTDPTQLRLKLGNDTPYTVVIDHLESLRKHASRWPRFASSPGCLLPPASNAQQGSSEATADWKATFLDEQVGSVKGKTLWDATGGSGIDLWSVLRLGARCRTTEPNPKMAALLVHNASSLDYDLEVVVATAEQAPPDRADIIYCDPSRLVDGQRTYHPSDCHPNVLKLIPDWRNKSQHILIKLSPMLDRSEAERLFPGADLIWLSQRQEVKELLVWLSPLAKGLVRAVDINDLGNERYNISIQPSAALELSPEPLTYLIDPDPVIMASRGVQHIATEFQLRGLSPHHNLLTTHELPPEHIPGRVFQVETLGKPHKSEFKKGFTIISRGFPAKADALRARFSCAEHDERVLIASSWGSNTQNFIQCSRIQRNLK